VPQALAIGEPRLATPSGASDREEDMGAKFRIATFAAFAVSGLAIAGPAGSHGHEEHGQGSGAETMSQHMEEQGHGSGAGTDSHGTEEHGHDVDAGTMLEQMREMHRGHEHGHDFGAIETMSPEQMNRVMTAMMDIGLAVPPMDAHRGREVFVDRGCVICHQVNGVGGEIGPSLNAADMQVPMNAFEFAARMWRGAGAMIEMQEQVLGHQIELTGQDLADLIAFAHDEAEQKELSAKGIPEQYRELIE
jgi:hypothetical protein